MVENILQCCAEDRDPGCEGQRGWAGKTADTRLTAGGREGASTQKEKGREYKEVSRLAEIASRRGEEKETHCVC